MRRKAIVFTPEMKIKAFNLRKGGNSYAQIGKALDVSPGTAFGLLKRMKQEEENGPPHPKPILIQKPDPAGIVTGPCLHPGCLTQTFRRNLFCPPHLRQRLRGLRRLNQTFVYTNPV